MDWCEGSPKDSAVVSGSVGEVDLGEIRGRNETMKQDQATLKSKEEEEEDTATSTATAVRIRTLTKDRNCV